VLTLTTLAETAKKHENFKYKFHFSLFYGKTKPTKKPKILQ